MSDIGDLRNIITAQKIAKREKLFLLVKSHGTIVTCISTIENGDFYRGCLSKETAHLYFAKSIHRFMHAALKVGVARGNRIE